MKRKSNGEREGDKVFREGYAQGAADTIAEIVASRSNENNGIEIELRRSYGKALYSGKKTISDLLSEAGITPTKGSSVSSWEIAEVPDAVTAIGNFLSEGEGGERVFDIFAGAFNRISALLEEGITAYLDAGGKKVGAMIALTYMTVRMLYKGRVVARCLTITAAAEVFGKGTGAVKRLLGRIRKVHKEAAAYIEDGGQEPNLAAAMEAVCSAPARLTRKEAAEEERYRDSSKCPICGGSFTAGEVTERGQRSYCLGCNAWFRIEGDFDSEGYYCLIREDTDD